MATAKKAGGLYVVRGVVVDANGAPIHDAPPIEPDTVPAPVGVAAPVVNIADQIAEGVARALALAAPQPPVAPEPDAPPAGKGK